MAKRDDTPENKQGRVAQVRAAYSITKEVQPRIGLMLAGIFLAVIVVFVAVGFVLKTPSCGASRAFRSLYCSP